MIRKMTIQDTRLPLHPKNKYEIIFNTGVNPVDLLEYLYIVYERTFVYEDENGLVRCLYGIDKDGSLFMFFTDINSLPMSFYKDMLKEKKKMLKIYGELHSEIMVRNTFAMDLAKFLGCEFSEQYKKGNEGFVKFTLKG